MTNNDIPLFLGDKIEEPGERRAVARLRTDLAAAGVPARIFANFYAGRRGRQIDVLVVTPHRLVHAELKCVASGLPLDGGPNGRWHQRRPDGSRHAFDRNPLTQALGGTYAVSDEMRDLASHSAVSTDGLPFSRHIDTVVCVFPEIPPGSTLRPHPHVDIVDYQSLLRRLTTPGPAPAWAGSTWDAFVRQLGVYREEPESSEQRHRRTNREALADYRARFATSMASGLDACVSLHMEVDGQITESRLEGLFLAGRAVTVTGPSGYGKSHMARHAAVAAAHAGQAPIWAHCGDYQRGRLDVLLSRAVAPFTTESAVALLHRAADAGTPVILVLDGINECPADLRGPLVDEVAALLLRFPIGLCVTSQDDVDLPRSTAVTRARLHLPDSEQRAAILRAHGAVEELPVDETFLTPYELAMAAACVPELPHLATRLDLIDAYVRQRAGTHAVRVALRHLAASMTSEARLSRTTAEAVVTIERAAPATVDETLSSPLLDVQRGRVRFAHETLYEFLAAEALVHDATTGRELGERLATPPCCPLQTTALHLERDAVRRHDALLALDDAVLVADGLRGAFGPSVRAQLQVDVTAVLRTAADITGSAELQVTGEPFTSRWNGPRRWNPEERLLLNAAGIALWHGLFLDDVGRVLDATDRLFGSEIRRVQAGGAKRPISDAVSAGYVLVPASPDLPASIIAAACHGEEVRRFRPATERPLAAKMMPDPQTAGWGRLYMAAMILNPADPDDAALVPMMVARAWELGGYHVHLAAIEAAHRTAHAVTGELRDQILDALREVNTDHIMLNTALIEALAAYDDIEPIATLADIGAHIAAVLQHEDIPDAWVAASGIVASQLDDERIVGPYTEAILDLPDAHRRRLYGMALRAPDSGFLSDWMLREIADNAADLDERGIWVLREAAATVKLDTPFWQEAVRAHLHGLRGWATLYDQLPEQGTSATAEQNAWPYVDCLIFDLHRPTTDAAATSAAWAQLMAARVEAVDALYQLATAGETPADPAEGGTYAQLVGRYAGRVREVFEWAASHRGELAEFRRRIHGGDRDRFVIRELGRLGTPETADLLRRFTADEDEDVGRDVVMAIHAIERRHGQ